MHFGIIVFPGTNCEHDCLHVVKDVMGHSGALVWHHEQDLSLFDGIIIPGGFAYGDYLRTGAVARFSPVMNAVGAFAALGKPVLGICNGFQVLCEAGLLPGVLRRNQFRHFICRQAYLRVEDNRNQFLHQGDVGDLLSMPVRHGEGNYYADPDMLAEMEANGQIILRYCDADGGLSEAANPNGSVGNIAGITNAEGTIFGLMPHPEAAAEPLLGSSDGLVIFNSMATPLASDRARSRLSGLLNLRGS